MDRNERDTGESGEDSPVARWERAVITGNWRKRPPRAAAGALPPRRRHTRKRLLALAVAILLVSLLVVALLGPRLLNRGELTVLIVGLDDTRNHLADTILFVHADLAAGKMAMLSVPRDTWIPEEQGAGHKANALLKAPGGLVRLGQYLHVVAPSRRVILTSDYLPSLVEAVGGVEVDVGPAPLNGYDKAGDWHIHLPAGTQHLMGKQAFGYARFRKPRTGPCPFCGATWKKTTGVEASDFTRIARQQKLVAAVLAKLRGPSALWRAPRALWAARRANSNLTLWQRLALANCLRRTGEPEFFVYPTRPSGRRLLPLPDAAGRLGGAMAGIMAGRIVVRNGAGSPGLASRVATLLARKGFLVARPGNAARAAHTTVEGPAELSRQVQEALGYGSCVYRDSKDVTVTIGLDAPNPE